MSRVIPPGTDQWCPDLDTPQNTPATKLDAIMDYNGRITQCAPTIAVSSLTAKAQLHAAGLTRCPPATCSRPARLSG